MKPVVGVAVALLVACTAPSLARDASVDAVAPLDAGHASPVLVTAARIDPSDPLLPASPRPADLRCLGTRMLLEPSVSVPLSLSLIDFRTGDPVTGACARVYREADVVASDGCTDTDPRSDALGSLTIVAPQMGPFHLRTFGHRGVAALDSYPDTTYYGLQAATRGVASGISDALLNEIALAAAVVRDPSRAIVGAIFIDCGGHPVYGAQLRLFRADGSPIEADAGGGRALYGDGTRHFTRSQPWTHIDGLSGMGNVAVVTPGERIFVEMIGRAHARDELSIVACETVQVISGGVSLPATIGPRRADGPECPELP